LKWTISANDRRREKAHPAPRETPTGASDQNIQIGVVPFFDCYHIQLFVLAAIHDRQQEHKRGYWADKTRGFHDEKYRQIVQGERAIFCIIFQAGLAEFPNRRRRRIRQ
jgi:hypothetical protein